MKRKTSLINQGKRLYDAPQCLCFSSFVENSILTGSPFNVTTEKFGIASEDDNDWM